MSISDLQMLDLDAFCISHKVDEVYFDDAADVALTLDKIDFDVDGYHVDERRFPQLGKALLKGKGKAASDFAEEDEDEERSNVAGSPNPRVLMSEDDPMEDSDDVVPPQRLSETQSEAGDTTALSRQVHIPARADFPELDREDFPERPHSTPALGDSSIHPRSKRRKVSSTGVRSRLASSSLAEDDNRLITLEKKLEDEAMQRRLMEQRLAERDEELRRLQEKRDEEMKRDQERRHADMMLLLERFMGSKLNAATLAPHVVDPPTIRRPESTNEGSGSQSQGSPLQSPAGSSQYSMGPPLVRGLQPTTDQPLSPSKSPTRSTPLSDVPGSSSG